MKVTNAVKMAAAVASCSTGVLLAVLATASPAGADPGDQAPPPAPLVMAPDAGPAPAPAPGPAPGPAADALAAAPAPDATVLPPNGMQHLASPDALPPGSTMDPQDQESPDVSYAKDLWQAVQNHEISGKEALILGLSQRGMNTPIPDQAPGPNVPITPGDPAPAPALGPAPAPAPPAAQISPLRPPP